MPATRKDLLDLLASIDVDHETTDHPAIFTVEEGRDLKAGMPGGHSKNLFVKDKKGTLFLVTAHSESTVDLVAMGKMLGAKGRLSFGKPDLMTEILGVVPGAVTPFALMNETAKALKNVVIDKVFMSFDRVWFHPLENTASTAIAPNDLLKFIEKCGFEPIIVDVTAPLSNKDEAGACV